MARLGRWLLPEGRRLNIAFVVALAAVGVVLILGRSMRTALADAPVYDLLAYTGVFVAIGFTSTFAALAALTHLAMSTLEPRRLVPVARLTRARRASAWLRFVSGRSSLSSETGQLLLITVVVILVLARRPEGLPMPLLLGITVLSILATWYSTVVNFAVEYAAEDSRGDALDIPGDDRPGFDLYFHTALMMQTSSSIGDVVPLTAGSRRLMHTQAVIAHITNSVVIALAVSVIITAL